MEKALLIILDGLGLGQDSDSNAFKVADTPVLDNLMKEYPNTKLYASGEEVGLPKGQIGNSEVGHLNIGAGRIVYQDLTRINKDIETGDFFENQVINEAIDSAKEKGKNLHLVGLVSKGGVHSSFEHLKALIKLAKKKNFGNLYIHAFLDGRDVLPKSAYDDIEELELVLKENTGTLSTIIGRYYAMDRDKRWERVERAYDAMVNRVGVKENPLQAIKSYYDQGINDEFMEPIICSGKGIEEGDSVVFFNFRADRARQLTRAFIEKDFNEFPNIKAKDLNLNFVTMTEYDANFENLEIAYGQEELKNTLGEYISSRGINQLRIAETEKYAHVTFFFNGGKENPFNNEDRLLVNSPKVATYDLKPEMSAYEVTDELVDKIEKDTYGLIIANYANPDMVGHTGVVDAAVKAVETVDKCLEKVIKAARDNNYNIIITADHGNCEQMKELGKDTPYTAHTTNQVPLILIGKDVELEEGILANIAPTILDLMGLEKPEEMTENSIIRR